MGQSTKGIAGCRFEVEDGSGAPSPMKSAAQRLAAMMRTGSCPNDQSFDRFLPEPLRLVSPEYWTPLAVVKRAADWLEAVGIRTVVDIGSGAGKFCAAGALFGRCRFISLEQYSSLVRSAVALVDLFDLSDRVSFVAGDLQAVTAPVGDAYYFFNPFTGSGQTIRRRQTPTLWGRDGRRVRLRSTTGWFRSDEREHGKSGSHWSRPS